MSLHGPCLEGDLPRLIELLNEQNADINEIDDDLRTPLHCAAFNGSLQCASYLLHQEGIKIDMKDKNGMSPLQLAGNTSILNFNQ